MTKIWPGIICLRYECMWYNSRYVPKHQIIWVSNIHIFDFPNLRVLLCSWISECRMAHGFKNGSQKSDGWKIEIRFRFRMETVRTGNGIFQTELQTVRPIHPSSRQSVSVPVQLDNSDQNQKVIFWPFFAWSYSLIIDFAKFANWFRNIG